MKEFNTAFAKSELEVNPDVKPSDLWGKYEATSPEEKEKIRYTLARARRKKQPATQPDYLEFALEDILDAAASSLHVKEVKIENERDFELVMWGFLHAIYGNRLEYKKTINGRCCDMAVGNTAIEMKFIKTVSDKDRCVGQALDYLKVCDKVFIIAIDINGHLIDLPKISDKLKIFIFPNS